MTTYNASAVADTVIAYQKSITLQQGRALRDNPLAMFEGASGAPRLQFAALGSWYSTAGAVGSYVFATRTTGTTDVAFGATLAGSNLSPTCATYSPASVGGAAPVTGAALSGTWQCMGYYDYSSGTSGANTNTTLWMRIS